MAAARQASHHPRRGEKESAYQASHPCGAVRLAVDVELQLVGGAVADAHGPRTARRDASDARVLAKLWRFAVYRDSGPTLILDRLQQVEHEAYLTLMAGRAGVVLPNVLAAGRFGPSNDAALVTRGPAGHALSEADGAGLTDGTMDEILLAVPTTAAARPTTAAARPTATMARLSARQGAAGSRSPVRGDDGSVPGWQAASV